MIAILILGYLTLSVITALFAGRLFSAGKGRYVNYKQWETTGSALRPGHAKGGRGPAPGRVTMADQIVDNAT